MLSLSLYIEETVSLVLSLSLYIEETVCLVLFMSLQTKDAGVSGFIRVTAHERDGLIGVILVIAH